VSVGGLAGILSGSRSRNRGQALDTMRDGAKRPEVAERPSHEPVLTMGGINQGNRHRIGAARIAVEQLLRTDQGPPRWPIPKPGDLFKPRAGTPSPKLAILKQAGRLDEEAARLFPNARPVQLDNLVDQLKALPEPNQQGHAGALAGPARLAGVHERAAMLLMALSASSGGDIGRAAGALQFMRQGLDITKAAEQQKVPAAAAAGPAAGRSPSPDAARLAWRTAHALSQAGGPGFEALLAVSAQPGASALETERRAQSLKIFLQTAEREPGGAAVRAPSDPNSIAGLAHSAAIKLWVQHDHTRAGLSPQEKSAHFNWRQNLRSPGTQGDLSMAQHRLHKSVKWMIRAEQRGLSRYNFTLNPLRHFGMRKSGFAPMQDGTKGAHLDTDAKENKKFDTAFTEGIKELNRALPPLDTVATPQQRMQQVLLAAKLDHWSAQIDAGTAPEACSFKGAAGQIVNAARALVHPADTATLTQLDNAGPGLLRSIRREPCKLETLQQWGRTVPAVSSLDAPFQKKMAEAADALDNRVMKPASMAIGDVAAYLKKYVMVVPLGNRLRNLDGATVGINNTSLPIATSPDARLRRMNVAAVEVNTSGHAHEIAFLKQHTYQVHGGAMHTTGVKLGELLQLGTTEGGNLGGEIAYVAGVRLRFLRRLDKDDVGLTNHKQKTADFIDAFAQAAQDQKARKRQGMAPMSADELWTKLLVDPHFDSPDLSVSWQDHRQQTVKAQAYSVNGINFRLGGDAPGDTAMGNGGTLAGNGSNHDSSGTTLLGASVTLGAEINPSIGLNRSERTGSLMRTVVQMGAAGHGILRGAAGVTAPGSGVPRAALLTASSDFAAQGTIAAARAVEENERLVSNFVYQDVEYTTYQSYEDGINANRKIWEDAVGKENLVTMMAETKKSFAQNQRPAERWRIRPDAARDFDALKAMRSLRQEALDNTTDPQQRRAIEAERDEMADAALKIFTDFNQWELVGSWNLEVNGVTKSLASLNFWVQASAERTVSTDRELSWAGSSTGELNRKTNAPAYPPPPENWVRPPRPGGAGALNAGLPANRIALPSTPIRTRPGRMPAPLAPIGEDIEVLPGQPGSGAQGDSIPMQTLGVPDADQVDPGAT
jgi:hypothetical protein